MIFEAGSFVPCGKISNGKHYSIITDHLGTPIEAYNQEGELIWEREQDLYGNSRQGFAKENFRCPFKYQGQYYDNEVELCYNRFRYYHPETGRYISEDPIKLLGGFNVFAYVSDTNAWVDLLGLDKVVPVDVILFGSRNEPKPVREGKDIKVEEDGIVKSQKNKEKKTGKSAFSFPLENAPLTGHYHTIKAGTELPNGLEIINDGEPFGEHSKGHYTIYPTEDMLFEEFQKRVSSIETEYGGKKSYK